MAQKRDRLCILGQEDPYLRDFRGPLKELVYGEVIFVPIIMESPTPMGDHTSMNFYSRGGFY